jgi:hypothetical protein
MNKYDQVVEWLCNHWITAIVLLVCVVLISIPQVRDGALLLWSWIKLPFSKKSRSKEDIILEAGEETVTFTELLRSIQHDVVKVHAHTHALGVAAEYEWIRRRYPGSEILEQALTTLDLIAGKKRYKSNQVHFDIIKIRLPNDRQKEIYFDISSFFFGGVSSNLEPDTFIARKIAHLYESK